MNISKFFFVLSLVSFLAGCHLSTEKTVTKPPVRNIILMIGDGMGLNQQYAVYTANKGSFEVERCPYVGLVKTYSANHYVTESAAAATAIACGEKTGNGMVGMRSDSTRLKSMLEYAADNDLATGIVITSYLPCATPAAFVAHVHHRDEYENIAMAYVQSKINVCIGGGRKFFENRTDSVNLTEMMKAKGFRVAYTMDEVKAIQEGNLLGLLAEDSLRRYPARGEMLPEATAATIQILNRNEKGFFLMVESSQIDWAGEYNDQKHLVDEMLDFNRTIKVALDFAEKEGQTLVIITGDHETGGMTITNGNLQTGELTINFSIKMDHSGVPVPVYAFGPGAELFTGIFDNTEFLPKVLNLFGINEFQ